MRSDAGIVALLGRPDTPADGVADYCQWLAGALERKGLACEVARVEWHERGWGEALRRLERRAQGWRQRWVLVQYTALAWSQRGFPWRFLRVLRVLRRNRARVAVVFHDSALFGRSRLVDRVRRSCQRGVMRQAYRMAHRVVVTLPPERVAWLPSRHGKAVFIPVGANIPPLVLNGTREPAAPESRTVAVFGVTEGPVMQSEVRDIGYILRNAQDRLERLRLVVFGRGSSQAEEALRRELDGSGIELSVPGLLPAEKVAEQLARADALLFVRGGISTRRSSALAGIACETPVVGYRSPETAFPLTEAGVVLAPLWDRQALSDALAEVLSRDDWRRQLRERNRVVQQQYLSWEAISRSFLRLVGDGAAP